MAMQMYVSLYFDFSIRRRHAWTQCTCDKLVHVDAAPKACKHYSTSARSLIDTHGRILICICLWMSICLCTCIWCTYVHPHKHTSTCHWTCMNEHRRACKYVLTIVHCVPMVSRYECICLGTHPSITESQSSYIYVQMYRIKSQNKRHTAVRWDLQIIEMGPVSANLSVSVTYFVHTFRDTRRYQSFWWYKTTYQPMTSSHRCVV